MRSTMKLGRIARPIPAGVPTLRDHAIIRDRAPASLTHRPDPRPALDGNDQVGDCTCVGIANAYRAQAALRGLDVAITTREVLALYAGSCGYDPANPATDAGGVEVDVLAYQARHGFPVASDPAPLVGLWANLEAGDDNLQRLVMARLGVVYLGVSLALADQADGVWDTGTPSAAGDSTPGSWGGHCLLAYAYTGTEPTDLVRLITWGRSDQMATWRWLRSRRDEAHMLAHPQLLGPDGLNAAGIDHAQLLADVAAYGSAP